MSHNHTTRDVLRELDGLVGLDSAKRAVREIIDFYEIDQRRRAAGLPANAPQTMHMVFLGSPGTGKTTVARIIGRLFHALTLLKTDKFSECQRAHFVGGFLGQTVEKTMATLNGAADGVLFIDDAYSLSRDDRDFYSKEVIDTLVVEMENRRSSLVIILAGYPDKMQAFLEENEGLPSRIAHTITFQDYDLDELLRIFVSYTAGAGRTVSGSVQERVRMEFGEALARCTAGRLGNGRFVRNFLERMMRRQATRLIRSGVVTTDELIAFDVDDVPLWVDVAGEAVLRGEVARAPYQPRNLRVTIDSLLRRRPERVQSGPSPVMFMLSGPFERVPALLDAMRLLLAQHYHALHPTHPCHFIGHAVDVSCGFGEAAVEELFGALKSVPSRYLELQPDIGRLRLALGEWDGVATSPQRRDLFTMDATDEWFGSATFIQQLGRILAIVAGTLLDSFHFYTYGSYPQLPARCSEILFSDDQHGLSVDILRFIQGEYRSAYGLGTDERTKRLAPELELDLGELFIPSHSEMACDSIQHSLRLWLRTRDVSAASDDDTASLVRRVLEKAEFSEARLYVRKLHGALAATNQSDAAAEVAALLFRWGRTTPAGRASRDDQGDRLS